MDDPVCLGGKDYDRASLLEYGFAHGGKDPKGHIIDSRALQ